MAFSCFSSVPHEPEYSAGSSSCAALRRHHSCYTSPRTAIEDLQLLDRDDALQWSLWRARVGEPSMAPASPI